MNAIIRLPYEAAWAAANQLAAAMPAIPSGGKIGKSLRARRGLIGRWRAWAGAYRDTSKQLLWMHASSAGESLQAFPVLQLFREKRPDLQLVLSFFSPSAELLAQKLPVNFADYLPFDTSRAMSAVIEAVQPSVIVFSKLDVWPFLVSNARHRNIPTALISATLANQSARRSLIASLLLRDAYQSLDAVGAIGAEDLENLIALGVRRDRAVVTGDTRYDQVRERSRRGRSDDLLQPLASTRPTLVAGSTWPSDEKRLLPGFAQAHGANPQLRLIIAPHEPDGPSIARIIAWSKSHRMSVASLNDDSAAQADVIVVDRMGVLGDLYAVADFAYVGGGFHRAGLHSILEPAAFAKPVIFGGHYGQTRDARLMTVAGGARGIKSAGDLNRVLNEWLSDRPARNRAGEAAEKVVIAGSGASKKSFDLVDGLLHAAR